MACTGCRGKTNGVRAAMATQSKYDFASDDDFVLVEYTYQYLKKLRSYTYATTTFSEKYGITNYGILTQGTQFYMLLTDYDYYLAKQPHITLMLVEAETESVDTESVDTESVDTESVDTESVDTESVDTESVLVSDTGDAPITNDLTAVKGVGAKTSEKLNDLGIYSYEQLAKIDIDTWSTLSPLATEATYFTMLADIENLIE